MTYAQMAEKYRSGTLTWEEAQSFVNEHDLGIWRFRGVIPMSETTPFTDEDISKELLCFANDLADDLTSYWAKKRKTFADVHGKARKRIKLERNRLKKRLLAYADVFNEYCGKPVLCVRARQGGNNRPYYPIDTSHPRYLTDIDSYFDDTYCSIFYDFTKEEETK